MRKSNWLCRGRAMGCVEEEQLAVESQPEQLDRESKSKWRQRARAIGGREQRAIDNLPIELSRICRYNEYWQLARASLTERCRYAVWQRACTAPTDRLLGVVGLIGGLAGLRGGKL